MDPKKYLIVNADDFGQSPGVNRGIIEAHKHGIVTSASLMTRWLAAGEAALYAKEHPKLSLGLHLDLGEWIWRNESWIPLYTVVPLEDKSAVEHEVSRQLDLFRYLVGKEPTHINSHQHVHMREPLRSVALRLSERLGVPLRNLCPGVHYSMKFYGQTNEGQPLHTHISLDRLIETLSRFPKGVTVLPCHPGYADDLKTMYKRERADELKVLCDPRLRTAITALGIKLCSFDDWKYFKNASDSPDKN
ncbi:MAG: carbohydrate deacetylase [Candidatus Binatia bacterium]